MQGSAADLIKSAMIAVQGWLDAERLQTRLLMQAHDELILEVPDDELARVRGELPSSAVGWTGDLRTRKITPANRPVADGRTVRPPTTPCGCFAENALNGYYRPEPAVAAQEIEPDERQRTHQ
jgi:hypothetical protein